MKMERETGLSKITPTLHLCKVPGMNSNIAACSNPVSDLRFGILQCLMNGENVLNF